MAATLCGAWRNATAHEAASWLSCPLLNNTAIEPFEEERFRCGLHGRLNELRKWQPCQQSIEPRQAAASALANNATFFFVGDSLARQAAKAMACKLLRLRRKLDRGRLVVGAPEWWYSVVNPRSRPHRRRGLPFCVRISGDIGSHLTRVCFISAWPSVLDSCMLLAQQGILKPGDAVFVNERMENGEQAALASMRRFATAVANASTVLGRATRAGTIEGGP